MSLRGYNICDKNMYPYRTTSAGAGTCNISLILIEEKIPVRGRGVYGPAPIQAQGFIGRSMAGKPAESV